MRVLILGVTGLLGNVLFRVLSCERQIEAFGTFRSASDIDYFAAELTKKLIKVRDLENLTELNGLIARVMPDVVINCISLSRKQHQDISRLIDIYAIFPQRLFGVCSKFGIRVIQISSDGVFSGKTGNYSEADIPDATDAYGKAKILGEIAGRNAVNLRVSLIGHELKSEDGLLMWFLKQKRECKCYTNAIFSGFPSVVFSQIVRDFILPNSKIEGTYHVASSAISKYDLLMLINHQYKRSITLLPDDSVVIDRSLQSMRFESVSGYRPPSWENMIEQMFNFRNWSR